MPGNEAACGLDELATIKENDPSEDATGIFEYIAKFFRASPRSLSRIAGAGSSVDRLPHSGVLEDLSAMHFRDLSTIGQLIKDKAAGEEVDDKTYLMERVIQLASELPQDSANMKNLTKGFRDMLWNDLAHPPLSYLDERLKYRQPDGSFNNMHRPNLGAAGTAYARSVTPRISQPYALPDPGVLFDSVMARKSFTPHPTKISSMLFYLASVITHDIFRTDHKTPGISLTSSYLDLSPLYGCNPKEQDMMRTFRDGRIKADCFSEKRVLHLPPGVGCLLIMFNRFHNFVVERLPVVNEGGRFDKPTDSDSKALSSYDENLFQTGRLVTCGLYINCILRDYVRVILNLNRTDSIWGLDPRSNEGQAVFAGEASGASGNQVSVEFNLVYRWHSTISQRDEKWTEEMFKEVFPCKDPNTISLPELVRGLQTLETSLPDDPQKRSFAKLERSPEGLLDDNALVEILLSGIEDVAGAFGANKVPPVLRAIEIMGIIQSRKWNLATLNEFREFFKLRKHETFEDINPDPEVAANLKNLYGRPDLVELYPGLVVEAAKEPKEPGSGLCPPFTTSRAILSDAVALVRGDRFYTVDYTRSSLTNWGFEMANYDVKADQGHVFYKLILRAFPNHFLPNSVYAHFPLTVPWESELIHYDLGIQDQYDYERPSFRPSPIPIHSPSACAEILSCQNYFQSIWDGIFTPPTAHKSDLSQAECMFGFERLSQGRLWSFKAKASSRERFLAETLHFYERKTIDLLKERSFELAGVNTVDIVRDIASTVHIQFAKEILLLPSQDDSNQIGVCTDVELYDTVAAIWTRLFYDVEPTKSFELFQKTKTSGKHLGELIEAKVEEIKTEARSLSIFTKSKRLRPIQEYGQSWIMQSLETGCSVKELTWMHIIPTAGELIVAQSQLFAQCLSFYLSDERSSQLKEITSLAHLNTSKANETILKYFMEAARLQTHSFVLRIGPDAQTIIDDGKSIELDPGSRVMLHLRSACRNASVFPNPEHIDITRPMSSYVHCGWGPYSCLSHELGRIAMLIMLKTIVKLKNIRRTPGPQGSLQEIALHDEFPAYLCPGGAAVTPFPTSLRVSWDGGLPELSG